MKTVSTYVLALIVAVGLAAHPLGLTAAADGAQRLFVRHLTSIVGDKDDFHPGDARDIPTRSMEFVVPALSQIEASPEQDPGVELDVGGANRPVGFTHAFDVPANASMLDARLRLRITSAGETFKNDLIYFEDGVAALAAGLPLEAPFVRLRHLLGFLPVNGEVYEIDIDLSHVPVSRCQPLGSVDCVFGSTDPIEPDEYVNLLPDLSDGQLDVIVLDDVKVDYSRLFLRVAFARR